MTCNEWWGQDQNDGAEMARFRRREIRDRWREVCEAAQPPLAQWIPMPDGFTVAYPRIEEIILGNPTAILIWLRPGQLPSDVEAYAPRIAYAMQAGRLRVRETGTPMLLRIEFLSHPLERVHHDIPRLPRPRTSPFAEAPLEGPDDGEAA
ncbi:MAG: hypothetical protein M3Z25_12050 [Actinomycetota bacterium]|nr:hypothetical protein [Actinomycetota bacterium]